MPRHPYERRFRLIWGLENAVSGKRRERIRFFQGQLCPLGIEFDARANGVMPPLFPVYLVEATLVETTR